jgi:hypothetical protein
MSMLLAGSVMVPAVQFCAVPQRPSLAWMPPLRRLLAGSARGRAVAVGVGYVEAIAAGPEKVSVGAAEGVHVAVNEEAGTVTAGGMEAGVSVGTAEGVDVAVRKEAGAVAVGGTEAGVSEGIAEGVGGAVRKEARAVAAGGEAAEASVGKVEGVAAAVGGENATVFVGTAEGVAVAVAVKAGGSAVGVKGTLGVIAGVAAWTPAPDESKGTDDGVLEVRARDAVKPVRAAVAGTWSSRKKPYAPATSTSATTRLNKPPRWARLFNQAHRGHAVGCCADPAEDRLLSC